MTKRGAPAVLKGLATLHVLLCAVLFLLSHAALLAAAPLSADDLSRRTSVTAANGTSSAYAYEDTGALDALSHTLGGGGSVAYGFDYNRALQIVTRTADNDLYAWTNHYNVTRAQPPTEDRYHEAVEDPESRARKARQRCQPEQLVGGVGKADHSIHTAKASSSAGIEI